MKPQYFISSLLIFFVLNGVYGDIVTDTCKKIADEEVPYDFCVATLQADPDSRTADLYELNLIAMRLGKANITSIESYIQTLSKDKKWDNLMQECFKTCMEMFDDGKTNLDDAMNEFNSKSYRATFDSLTAALQAPSSCEETFTEFEGLVSPLTKMNGDCNTLFVIPMKITLLFK
ncbi:hypothetical protein ACHQM5_002499 [Ranunculus cassubicifolius]